MRKKNLVLIIALVLLVTLLATVFVACNKKEEDLNRDPQKEAELRVQTLDKLCNAMLLAENEKWKYGATEDEIAALSDAGTYIINSSWVSFFRDVVDTAGIKTAKIDTMADVILQAIEDEKAKKESGEGGEDPDSKEETLSVMNYIRMFINGSDLLGDEMSALAYALMYQLIDKADQIYAKAYELCQKVSVRTDISPETRASLTAANKEITRAQDVLADQLPEQLQLNILASMEESKNGFVHIFSTMYDALALLSIDISSIMKGGDIDSSSISSLSTQDILNVLGSVKKTIQTADTYFDENKTEVAQVSKTLKDISSVVDTMVATNKIIGGALGVIRISSTALAIIPFGLSFLLNSWGALDETFINDVKTQFITVDKNKKVDANIMIFLARMIVEYRKNTGATFAESKEYTHGRIDEIDSYVDNDVYAALLYMGIDAFFNVYGVLRYVEADPARTVITKENLLYYLDRDYPNHTSTIESTLEAIRVDFTSCYNIENSDEGITDKLASLSRNEIYSSVTRPVGLYIALNSFEKVYVEYLLDEDAKKSSLISAGQSLYTCIQDIGVDDPKYIVTNPDDNTNITNAWYINFYNAAMEAFYFSREKTKKYVNPDVKHYVDELYVTDPEDYLLGLSSAPFATADDQASIDVLSNYAEKLIILKVLSLLPTILKAMM